MSLILDTNADLHDGIQHLETNPHDLPEEQIHAITAFDDEFHRRVDIDEVATSLAFGADALSPDRVLTIRGQIELAARLARLLPRIPVPVAEEDGGVTPLWDESLARLGWLIRVGHTATGAIQPMADALLARYAMVGHDAAAVAQRLAAQHARSRHDAPAGDAPPPWHPLCRFVARPDVVGTIRLLERQPSRHEHEPERLAPIPPSPPPPSSDSMAILDRAKLAERLGISISSVDRLIADGLPCFRVGRGSAAAVRIRWAAAIQWLEQRERAWTAKSVRKPRRDGRR